MKLTRFQIENFRGIESLDLALDKTTVLIGENNAGKSSVLEALNICMTRGLGRRALPFGEFDYRLADGTSDPREAPPISLTLTFEEAYADEWPVAVVQSFPNVVQVQDDGRHLLAFRVQAQFDHTLNEYAVDWFFLNIDASPMPSARNPKLVSDLQAIAPVFLLSAMRDASQHFNARSPFWAPFTRSMVMSDEQRIEIEEHLARVNQSVLDGNEPFKEVKDGLAKTGRVLPLGPDPVSIEAVPARIMDMLARTQVKLATLDGARLPVGQHGAGTQSLSVLFLFEAFLAHRLAETFDVNAEPLLALEEPEAHLHPSAVRSLWPMLEGLDGQKLIATHSGDLLSAVPLDSVRRMARKDGRVQVFQMKPGTLDVLEGQRVAYHVRAKRGALLFARCWLLVEGETEFVLLPALARAAGIDLELEGVSCVEFPQCGLAPLIKVARDLGIEWHVLADGDQAGHDYAQTAGGLLAGDLAADRITRMTALDTEHSMWSAGYQHVYENAISAGRKATITSPRGTPEYATETIKAAARSTSKPQLAHAIAAELDQPGAPAAPTELLQAINQALTLAKRLR